MTLGFLERVPSGEHTKSELENGPVEIVDFPIKNGGSFHCYVSSPEGRYDIRIYQEESVYIKRPSLEDVVAQGLVLLCQLSAQ